MRRVLFALLAAALLGAAPTPEPIGMTMLSRGKLVANWKIYPDGSIVAMTDDDRNPGDASRMVVRQTGATPGRYEAIEAMLRPARAVAGRKLPCKNPMTDAPSGDVTWGKDVKLDYYGGCHEEKTRAVVDLLFKANEQVAAWTKDAPASATVRIAQ